MSADDFDEIVDQHYGPLYKFAFSLTRTEADARDLTQNTFYVFATKGHQLRDGSKVKAWLFTTLHRTFLKSRRKQQRLTLCGLDEVRSEELPILTLQSLDTSDYAHVLRALAQVDEVYQAAIALFYLEDYSYREIAEILEVPIGTIKSRIARGLAQLRQTLLPDSFPRRSMDATEVALGDVLDVTGYGARRGFTGV